MTEGKREELFTNKQIRQIAVPLFLEQFLVLLVGIADTLVVSFAGEASVSGVSLVDSFNTIMVFLFAALSAGGSVVVSQYIGRKQNDKASEAAGQLFTFAILLSLAFTVIILPLHRQILGLLFGKVEEDVMVSCIKYLKVLAFSYPALAAYNAGAAVYRSMGKTKPMMYISIVSNLINIVGNVIGVLVLKGGVLGVAYPTLISRYFSAVVIVYLCIKGKDNIVSLKKRFVFSWNGILQKTILKIAIPNAVENAAHQAVKVAMSSLVSLFGTYQIAANGIAQTIWTMSSLAGITMGTVYITVIGRSMGTGDTEMTIDYFKRLMRQTFFFTICWNAFVFFATWGGIWIYPIEDQTKELIVILVLIHNVGVGLSFHFGGALSYGLRAVGDVTYTMVITLISTAIRLILSVVFAVTLGLGVIGIALAMDIDWIFRAVFIVARFKGGKWKRFHVI